MYDIEQLRREEFPLSQEYIFFNHASVSPIPIRTKNRMIWATEKLAENPWHFFQDDVPLLNEQIRATAVAYINADNEREIVPITSTSMGINGIAQGIDWQTGDNVVFCDSEFPANAYPWMVLDRYGVDVRLATAVGGGLELSALKPLVDENTRLVAVSAIQFFSGHRADLQEIGNFCHENGTLFIVDAIQAIGHMPIDVQAMHIDALVTGGQKSLLAPPGIGFMYIREAFAETLTPRYIGGNATKDFLHWLNYDMTPLPGAHRFASGTSNVVGLSGLQASLGLLQELGVANIGAHTAHLGDVAIERIEAIGYDVITPRQAHGPIVTFKSGKTVEQTDETINQLRAKNINVVKHLDAPGTPHIRASFHAYNTVEEVERFVQILQKLG